MTVHSVAMLSPEDVLVIHARIIDATGGSHGIRDVGLLASACARPYATFGGKPLYATVFEQAAALLESLARHHVFIDGNKRTSLAAAAYYLEHHGHQLIADNDEVEQLVLDVVTKHLTISVIAAWLKKHV